MEPKIEQPIPPTFEQLVNAARSGQEENWNFIDKNINDSHLTSERIDWALKIGLFDADDNIRDFAATLLDRSDNYIPVEEVEKLQEIMGKDTYDIVRYRIAIALYKRGNRDPKVVEKMQEAKDDPNVGKLASSFLE